ncbi:MULTISPECIES: hypothetical protein [Bacillati]|uniref:hypothetical protein n=1 Tax=Bacillati TaxID=1783272 RepID=UPI0035D87ED9
MSNPEVAKELDVAASSLRKWCIALEEQNYSFERTDQSKRLFYHGDLVVLRFFKELVTNKNMSLKNAAIIVTDRFAKKNNKVFFNGSELEHNNNIVFSHETNNERRELSLNQDQLLSILETHREQLYGLLKDQLKNEILHEVKEEIRQAQNDSNERLLNSIKTISKEQEKQISKTIEERDKYIVENLKNSMITRKEIAASIESEKKKKKWYRWWK